MAAPGVTGGWCMGNSSNGDGRKPAGSSSERTERQRFGRVRRDPKMCWLIGSISWTKGVAAL